MPQQDRRAVTPRRASERRRLEQLRHDLNNPLTVLLGATWMLAGTHLTEQQQRCVAACRSALRQVSELLQSVGGGGFAGPSTPEEDADRLSALGVSLQLTKPFDRAGLLAVIGEVAGDTRRLEILVIDDSVEIAWLVGAFLEGTRHRLTVAVDGRAGCEMAKAGAYDLILLDLNLPTLDGVSVLQAVREWEQASGRSPMRVVAMPSGHAARQPRKDRSAPRIEPDEDIAALVPAFLERRREDLQTMYDALDAGDYASIRTIAHRMKGTGRSYGLDAVSEIGGRLESAAAAHHADAVLEALEALSDYLSVVVVE
jgi:CheY-like chemotaxis protein